MGKGEVVLHSNGWKLLAMFFVVFRECLLLHCLLFGDEGFAPFYPERCSFFCLYCCPHFCLSQLFFLRLS